MEPRTRAAPGYFLRWPISTIRREREIEETLEQLLLSQESYSSELSEEETQYFIQETPFFEWWCLEDDEEILEEEERGGESYDTDSEDA